MLRLLEQRIAKLESSPALTWEAFFESLTDEELMEIAGEDCRGVPWAEFTDEELEAIARGDESVIEIGRVRYNGRR